MFQLFITETHQCLQGHLVTEKMFVADFQHLGADETFHQAKHIGIGSALHLAEKFFLDLRQEGDLIHFGQAIGQEFFIKIKVSTPDHILINIPTNAFGYLDTLCITLSLNLTSS